MRLLALFLAALSFQSIGAEFSKECAEPTRLAYLRLQIEKFKRDLLGPSENAKKKFETLQSLIEKKEEEIPFLNDEQIYRELSLWADLIHGRVTREGYENPLGYFPGLAKGKNLSNPADTYPTSFEQLHQDSVQRSRMQADASLKRDPFLTHITGNLQAGAVTSVARVFSEMGWDNGMMTMMKPEAQKALVDTIENQVGPLRAHFLLQEYRRRLSTGQWDYWPENFPSDFKESYKASAKKTASRGDSEDQGAFLSNLSKTSGADQINRSLRSIYSDDFE